MKNHTALSCLPDGITLIGANVAIHHLLDGHGDVEVNRIKYWVAPVEVQTKIASTTLGLSIGRTDSSPIFIDVRDDRIHELVPSDHFCQML